MSDLGCERFIREYASYRIKCFKQCEKMFPHQKDEWEQGIDNCNKAVRLRGRRYITEDEAIRLILEAV